METLTPFCGSTVFLTAPLSFLFVIRKVQKFEEEKTLEKNLKCHF
jgi:hypothetical protein